MRTDSANASTQLICISHPQACSYANYSSGRFPCLIVQHVNPLAASALLPAVGTFQLRAEVHTRIARSLAEGTQATVSIQEEQLVADTGQAQGTKWAQDNRGDKASAHKKGQ